MTDVKLYNSLLLHQSESAIMSPILKFLADHPPNGQQKKTIK